MMSVYILDSDGFLEDEFINTGYYKNERILMSFFEYLDALILLNV